MPLTQDESEEFKALIALAEFTHKRRQERTTYEWGMSFAVWAGLGAAAHYVTGRPPWWMISLALISVCTLYAWYILDIRTRNQLDNAATFAYFNKAAAMVSSASKATKRNMSLGWGDIQIPISVILAVIAFVMIEFINKTCAAS